MDQQKAMYFQCEKATPVGTIDARFAVKESMNCQRAQYRYVHFDPAEARAAKATSRKQTACTFCGKNRKVRFEIAPGEDSGETRTLSYVNNY